MNKHFLIPVVLLATTPFAVACTKKPTDMPPPPPPVTGKTETVTPSTVAPSSSNVPAHTGANTEANTVAPPATVKTKLVSYDSKTPEWMVDIEFSATVIDGVITAASATPKTDKQWSLYNQSNFAKELSAKVVGKKAKDLDVDAIGGASLTTDAFESFVHSF